MRWGHIRKPYKTPGSLDPEVQAVDFYRLLPESLFGKREKNMDKFIEAYLDRASELIGDRTASEAAYDDAVVEALNQGRPIGEALSIAGRKYPGEAISWDNSTIGDIAAHYDYLKEHARIMKMLGKRRQG